MWVIPKNLHASNGLLAGLETIKDSAELSQICAVSLFVRGKDTQSQTWLKRWKQAGWHQRLSGRIAAPFPSNRSLIEGWISSLLPIRARANRSPATSSAPKILDSYGRIVETSLQQLDLFSAFSKTSEDTSTPQWSKSSATWQSFSTQLSQEYLARKSAAAAIRGRGFLSLRGTLWPTAVAQDDNKSPEAHLAMKKRMKGGERTAVTSLNVMSKMWPIPRTITGGAEAGVGEAGVGEAGVGRRRPAIGSTELVHSDCGRPQGGPSRGVEVRHSCAGILRPEVEESGCDLEHPESIGRGEGWPESSVRGGRDTVAESSGELADADASGLGSGRLPEREHGDADQGDSHMADALDQGLQGSTGKPAHGGGIPRQAGRGGADFPQSPPGPNDADGWYRVLFSAPWLAPSLRRSEAERIFRRVADGLAHESHLHELRGLFCENRVDRLRMLGNGVYPDSAAVAFVTLLGKMWRNLC